MISQVRQELRLIFLQIPDNFKNSKKYIIILGCILSLSSGLGFYSDAVFEHTMKSQFYLTADFLFNIEIENSSIIPTSCSELKSASADLVASKQFLTESYPFLQLSFSSAYLNLSSDSSFPSPLIQPTYFLSDSNFYKSSSFAQSFTILRGTIPTSPNEILLEYSLAKSLHVTVDSWINASYIVFSDEEGSYENICNIEKISLLITGFYSANYERIEHYPKDFTFPYNTVKYDQNMDLSPVNYIDKIIPFFGFYNFTNMSAKSPIIQQYTIIEKNATLYRLFTATTSSSQLSPFTTPLQIGCGLFYDRTQISYTSMIRSANQISEDFSQLELSHQVNYDSANLLTPRLYLLFEISKGDRTEHMMLLLPVLVASLYFGRLILEIRSNQRKHGLLLKRLRGISFSRIYVLFAIEICLIALWSTLLGILLGQGTFFLFQAIFQKLFSSFQTIPFLTPKLFLGPIWITLLVAVIITSVSYFKILWFIRKLHLSHLYSVLQTNQDNNSSTWDESCISDNTLKWYSNSGSSVIKNNNISKHKFGIPLICAAVVPYFLYFIAEIGKSLDVNDFFIAFSDFIYYQTGILPLVFIIAAMLFIIGILRLILVEKPQKMAKWLVKLGKKILFPIHSIGGLEFLRRKNLKRVFYLMAVLFSLVTYLNISLYSQLHYEQIANNLLVGADIKAEFQFTPELIDLNFSSPEFHTALPNLLNPVEYYSEFNFKQASNIQAENCFLDTSQSIYDSMYLNFSNYLRLITNRDKIPPYPQFNDDIQDFITQIHPSQSSTPVFVSPALLLSQNVKIGDLIEVIHTVYDLELNRSKIHHIPAQIYGIIDILPGIYASNNAQIELFFSSRNIVFFDNRILNNSFSLLHGTNVIHLATLADPSTINQHTYTSFHYQEFNHLLGKTVISFFDFSNPTETFLNGVDDTAGIYYYQLLLIGGLIAVELGFLVILDRKTNSRLYLLYYLRGVKKKQLLRIDLLIILTILGTITVLSVGFSYLCAYFSMKVSQKGYLRDSLNYNVYYIPKSYNYPVYGNFTHLGLLAGIIIIIPLFMIWVYNYFFRWRKFFENNQSVL